MSGSCRKCGTRLDSPWKFCPLCGVDNAQAAGVIAKAHPEHEKAPVKSGFSGLVLGLITAPVLIIPGVLMCLMVGPWMVIGIPFIVAGICAPICWAVDRHQRGAGKLPVVRGEDLQRRAHERVSLLRVQQADCGAEAPRWCGPSRQVSSEANSFTPFAKYPVPSWPARQPSA